MEGSPLGGGERGVETEMGSCCESLELDEEKGLEVSRKALFLHRTPQLVCILHLQVGQRRFEVFLQPPLTQGVSGLTP